MGTTERPRYWTFTQKSFADSVVLAAWSAFPPVQTAVTPVKTTSGTAPVVARRRHANDATATETTAATTDRPTERVNCLVLRSRHERI
jgi:hypothetical protein